MTSGEVLVDLDTAPMRSGDVPEPHNIPCEGAKRILVPRMISAAERRPHDLKRSILERRANRRMAELHIDLNYIRVRGFIRSGAPVNSFK